MATDFLYMGRIGRPHGIKGDLTLEWVGEQLPKTGTKIWLQSEQPKKHIIKAVRNQGDKLIISLDGVDDRNAADSLKGASVMIRRDAIAPPDEDEAFLADLVGCGVYTSDGDVLGRLDHFEFPGEQVIWSIKDSSGREILFPAREEFIVSLNPAAGKIVVSPPEGLLDIYRA